MPEIKFNKYNVTNSTDKARCRYSLDNRADGRKCVAIHAKDYDRTLGKIFTGGEYQNDTDSMTDYFDQGRVVLFENHPLYAKARIRAEAEDALRQKHAAEYDAKLAIRYASYA